MKNITNDIQGESIRSLKGVGEARALFFKRLGLFTVRDVIMHFPRDYEDRSRFKSILQMQDGENCAFEGIIASGVKESRPRRGLTVQRVAVKDNTGTITAVWFNQSYLKNTFETGERYIFYGRVNRRHRAFEMLNPVYEKVEGGEMKNTCRIIPLYPSTSGLTQNVIRSVIRSALKQLDGKMEEILPASIRNGCRLSEINYSLQNIHFPKSDEDFKNARYRLVFEELLLLQLGLLNIKNTLGNSAEGIAFGKIPDMQQFIDGLPFKLTGAQQKVFSEIERDMESTRVMNRLVQGDVGSGKTIVAVLALYKTVRNGYQGTLMVPTEILAEQHYKTIDGLFGKCGIKTSLFTGNLPLKQKARLLEDIKSGEVDVVIGTHALIENDVVFGRLGLVVTDEQHRFGVRQRAALSQKGESPDVVVMTATPIPRTLALILYGDLDISVVDELPPGRKPVETYAVDGSMRDRINKFIRKKVSEGRQVFVVCPLVEESDAVEAKSAVKVAQEIAERDFCDLKTGLIHGKMKAKDKEDIMNAFVKGEISILVSTTVIEVGVNVPNATVMVIENAERFGLAQLHQLRGRVGRGEHQSYCILYNESKSGISNERMKVMQKTNDGFIIAEKDLEMRGAGEFFGTRQHGIPELKIANLYNDIEILKLTQKVAFDLLKEDRFLQKPENIRMREAIRERFDAKSKEITFN